MKNKIFNIKPTIELIANNTKTFLSTEIYRMLKNNHNMNHMNEEYEALADDIYLQVIEKIK